jgi:uncharacterized protein (TIGR03067 family)
MKNLLMIALCGSILAAGCSKSHTPESVTAQKPDSVVLQGTWSGQELGVKAGSPSLVIEGTKMEFHGANSQEWYKATFSLREDTAPKQLEAVITECPFAQYVGKTTHGVYQIEDGRLTFAANEPGNPAVPASFDAQGARKFVLTRK